MKKLFPVDAPGTLEGKLRDNTILFMSDIIVTVCGSVMKGYRKKQILNGRSLLVTPKKLNLLIVNNYSYKR